MERDAGIELTKEEAALAAAQVASGRYGSTADVVREAMHLFEERESWLEDIRGKVAAGLAQADAGELLDGPTVMAELLAEFDRPQSEPGADRKKSA